MGPGSIATLSKFAYFGDAFTLGLYATLKINEYIVNQKSNLIPLMTKKMEHPDNIVT
jgi:hypothetical protein